MARFGPVRYIPGRVLNNAVGNTWYNLIMVQMQEVNMACNFFVIKHV